MKTKYNIKILLIFMMLGLIACENDGGDSVIETSNGALPDFSLVEGSSDFIDLTSFDDLMLQFTVDVGIGTPESFDLKAFYLTAAGDLYGPATLDENVTTFPKEYAISGADIINAFPELNSVDDVQVGDVFKLFTGFTFSDGSSFDILNENGEANYYAPDFDAFPMFTAKLDYVVSCESDLEGTHSFVSTNLQAAYGYGCPSGEVTGTVVWTAQGGGTYLTSDLGFGQYESSCWNDTPATSGGATFTEVCGEIISGGTDQYGLTYIWVITGVNGSELSMSWSNDYGDSGDVVITREGGADWPALFTE